MPRHPEPMSMLMVASKTVAGKGQGRGRSKARGDRAVGKVTSCAAGQWKQSLTFKWSNGNEISTWSNPPPLPPPHTLPSPLQWLPCRLTLVAIWRCYRWHAPSPPPTAHASRYRQMSHNYSIRNNKVEGARTGVTKGGKKKGRGHGQCWVTFTAVVVVLLAIYFHWWTCRGVAQRQLLSCPARLGHSSFFSPPPPPTAYSLSPLAVHDWPVGPNDCCVTCSFFALCVCSENSLICQAAYRFTHSPLPPPPLVFAVHPPTLIAASCSTPMLTLLSSYIL